MNSILHGQPVPPDLDRTRLEAYEAALASRLDPACGLLRQDGPGHTVECRALSAVHDGRATAEWVALRCLLRGPTPEEQPAIDALLRLQVTAPESPRFGCSRWYGEETTTHDTNAAFFICRLLAVRWLLDARCADTPAGAVLRPYFARSAAWFAHECREPILYYTNKILSDGCIALALAHILDEPGLRAEAEAFLDRWCAYTENRGWGWGENLSVGYAAVILDAFWLALQVLPVGERRQRLLRLHDKLVENLAFHAPEQPVPAIRTYNFAGETRCRGGIYSVLGLMAFDPGATPAWLSALLLANSGSDVQARVTAVCASRSTAPVRRRTQRIFDDTVATTYIEGGARLGTINRFPVMPGCNQHLTWGLGWQSMPASFLVQDRNYGYVQWETRLADGGRRTHPSSAFLGGHSAPALFAEALLPEMVSVSRQQDRVAVTVRSVLRLANVCGGLWDQWRVPSFCGQCRVDGQEVRSPQTIGTEGWGVLLYPGCAVALRALQVLPYGAAAPLTGTARVEWQDGALLVRQILWPGPATQLLQERVECGWVTVLLPGVADGSEAEARLREFRIVETWPADAEWPRQAWQRSRRVQVAGPGVDLTLEVDPWRLPRT